VRRLLFASHQAFHHRKDFFKVQKQQDDKLKMVRTNRSIPSPRNAKREKEISFFFLDNRLYRIIRT